MTYHTVLKTNDDFIGALRHARNIADNITIAMQAISPNSSVFPYRFVDLILDSILIHSKTCLS